MHAVFPFTLTSKGTTGLQSYYKNREIFHKIFRFSSTFVSDIRAGLQDEFANFSVWGMAGDGIRRLSGDDRRRGKKGMVSYVTFYREFESCAT